MLAFGCLVVGIIIGAVGHAFIAAQFAKVEAAAKAEATDLRNKV